MSEMDIPITVEPRRCPACHKPLVRRPKETPSYFKRRTYCDGCCANLGRNQQRMQEAMARLPPRYCKDCNALLVRRPGERLDVFRKCVHCLTYPVHRSDTSWPA